VATAAAAADAAVNSDDDSDDGKGEKKKTREPKTKTTLQVKAAKGELKYTKAPMSVDVSAFYRTENIVFSTQRVSGLVDPGRGNPHLGLTLEAAMAHRHVGAGFASRETIVVNEAADPFLVKWVAALVASRRWSAMKRKDVYKAVAMSVHSALDGNDAKVRRAVQFDAVFRQWQRDHAMQLAMPLGDIIRCGVGVCRHRSILTKLVCDSIASSAPKLKLRCRVVRGKSKHAHVWNVIRFKSTAWRVMDVMKSPGELLKLRSKAVLALTRFSPNATKLKKKSGGCGADSEASRHLD